MGSIIPFSTTRIRYIEDIDKCICCNENTGEDSYRLELTGDSLHEKRIVAMCPACHDEMPEWLWKDKKGKT